MDLTSTVIGFLIDPLLSAAAGDRPDGEIRRTLGVGATEAGDERVPIRDAGHFWSSLATLSHDPLAGLHAAERVGEHGLGLVECIGRASSTFGDAVERGIRYVPLLADLVAIDLIRDGETAALAVRTTVGTPFPLHAADFIIASIVLAMRRVLGDDAACTAHLVHAAPDDLHEHARVLRCPTTFDAPRDEVRFSIELLERCLPQADDRVRDYLDRYATEQLAQLPPEPGFGQRLRRAYADAIERGDASIHAVGRKLAMSARTLQRRLHEAGTSHRRLLDAIRHELAVTYLRDAERTVESIATRLGYADASTFARAFRRRSGVSPGALRSR